jgi:heat shock protein HtpX
MGSYVGIVTQQRRNNLRSILLLLCFPCIIIGMIFLFFALIYLLSTEPEYRSDELFYDQVVMPFSEFIPIVIFGVLIWFAIAYFTNTSMIRSATNARSLSRRENPRVYNLVENLCIANGMDMPKINVIDDPQLNAFASGIDKDSYTVTVTTGIMACLNDEELEGVIAHELTHIRNRDTRLLIISIIFVGIISAAMQMIIRMFFYGPGLRVRSSSSNDERKDSGVGWLVMMIIAIVCSVIAYVFALLTRFAISRKREFMADAGGAEMTQNPRALASALRKISGNPALQDCSREDVAQLFIFHQSANSILSGLFSTHPDIKERIRVLEQF